MFKTQPDTGLTVKRARDMYNIFPPAFAVALTRAAAAALAAGGAAVPGNGYGLHGTQWQAVKMGLLHVYISFHLSRKAPTLKFIQINKFLIFD